MQCFVTRVFACAVGLILGGTVAASSPACADLVARNTHYTALAATSSSPADHPLSPVTNWLAFLSPVQSGDPPDPEQAYLDALRERKLFRLLETYCRKQLARTDATPAERARFTIELANILATRAQTEPQTATRV